MTAELVNLRRARKAKAREAATAMAARNRARHGRPKAERALEAAREAQTAHVHDGKKRED